MSETTCPKCNFNDHLDEVVYCQECGTLLVNECTNENCDTNNLSCSDNKYLADNAKYCHYCGSETTFKKQGFFE